MLNKIILFSIKNKLTIGVGTLMLIVWGSYSLSKLPIDAVPDITDNQVQIITTAPSLAAPEVERLISFPIELKLANIAHTDKIRSFSRFGLSVVTIVFDESVDIYWARQQVSERLQQLQNEIPAKIGIPEMAPITTGLGEIYQYVVEAEPEYKDQYSLQELRNIQDWIIRRQLLGTPGVADVSALGGKKQQFEIALNPEKLSALGLSISDVFTALENNNENTGGAYIEKQDASYFIRTDGLVGSLTDIERIPINTKNGDVMVLIKDIAEVHLGYAVRYGASTRNGNGEVVSAIVMMMKGENTSEVIEAVKAKMDQIRETLPRGIQITPFLDRTSLVNRAISTVQKNLIEGALIVIWVLLLILGDLRAGLIVASVIPLALMFAFGMMYLFGVSGNLMSLGAIDFGLIVDGAVIIVEASMHHLGLKRFTRRLSQQEMDQEIFISSSNIRNAAAFGEIIILIVYIPLLVLVGTEGKMFRPMAQTVSFAIMGAFLLSLTYVPVASALFLSKNPNHKISFSDRLITKLQHLFEPILRNVLSKKLWVLTVSILLLILSIWRFSLLGGEFIPTLDEGDFAVQATVLTGGSLSASIAATQKAEKLLLTHFPEVKQVVSKIGSGEIPTDPMPIEAADIMVILKDKSLWVSAQNREQLVDSMSRVLSDIKGVNFSFQQPIQMRFNELMTGVRQDVAIKIFGEDLNQLSRYAQQVGALAETIPGAEDIYVEEVTGVPQIVVAYDRLMLARYGLEIQQVNQQVNIAFGGASAGKVYQGERSFDMVLRLGSERRMDIEDVKNLPIIITKFGVIPLNQLGKVSLIEGPYQIQRDDTKRRIIVAFNIRNADVETVVKLVEDKIKKNIDFEPGYSVRFGGQFENLVQAKDRLSVAVPIALFLIFFLLYVTFKSFAQSLLIFTAIPFSAIGGIWALSMRGMPFSISAGVGFIALFGVAVLNGIVLISEFNSLKKKGMESVVDRVIMGTRNRLRPVLMTAAVASLGFLPMAISSSAGAEVQKPLATVVIGGLVSATMLTLLVLPVLYALLEQRIHHKMKINMSPAVLIFLFMGILPLGAQTGITIQNLDQAVEQAIASNKELESKSWQYQAALSSVKTSVTIPATSVDLMLGQYNSIFSTDNHINVSQQVQNPFFYYHQYKGNQLKAQLAQWEYRLEQARIVKSVKSSWTAAQFANERHALLIAKKLAYETLLSGMEIRARLGDATDLDLQLIRTALKGIQIQAQQEQLLFTQHYRRLKQDLNLSERDSILVNVNYKLKTIINDKNTDAIPIKLLQTDVLLKDRLTKAEKSLWLPTLRVSYFNQSLNGPGSTLDGRENWYNSTDRFTGMSFGLDIPLFSGVSQWHKVAALSKEKKSAESHATYVTNQWINQMQQLKEQINLDQVNLDYFQLECLPVSSTMELQLLQQYKQGAISVFEFTRGMEQVWNYRLQYIDAQLLLQQHLIEFEFQTQN